MRVNPVSNYSCKFVKFVSNRSIREIRFENPVNS